jgi:hypothetical protein
MPRNSCNLRRLDSSFSRKRLESEQTRQLPSLAADISITSSARRRGGRHPSQPEGQRASLVAQSRRIETEAAPIRYVAELVGTDADSEARSGG